MTIEDSNKEKNTSELGVNSSKSCGWSKEFIAAFSRFGDTPDDTLVAPDDPPINQIEDWTQ